MRGKSFLLRLLLCVTLCLNGSTALWASTRMALDPSHMVPANAAAATHEDHARPDACGHVADCPEPAVSPDAVDRHAHAGDDCRCGAGILAGCSCGCAYPASAIAVSVPFAARHVLQAAAPVYVETRAPLQESSTIFRPPIG